MPPSREILQLEIILFKILKFRNLMLVSLLLTLCLATCYHNLTTPCYIRSLSDHKILYGSYQILLSNFPMFFQKHIMIMVMMIIIISIINYAAITYIRYHNTPSQSIVITTQWNFIIILQMRNIYKRN